MIRHELELAQARIKELEGVNLALIAERDKHRDMRLSHLERLAVVEAERDALLKEREETLKQAPVGYMHHVMGRMPEFHYRKESHELAIAVFTKPLPPAIPEGMALVPVELTEEIGCAITENILDVNNAYDIDAAWDAAISAAKRDFLAIIKEQKGGA